MATCERPTSAKKGNDYTDSPLSSFEDKLELNTIMYMDLVPAELLEVVFDVWKAQACQAAVESALKVGDIAPDFSLFGTHGKVVSTAALREKGPVVVNFFRGGWCAYCGTELQEYQRLLAGFHGKGASVVSVSPETTDRLAEVVSKLENELVTSKEGSSDDAATTTPSLTLLSDVNLKIARCFGLAFDLEPKLIETYQQLGMDQATWNGMKTWVLPVPATYVIGQDGTILYSYVNGNPVKRVDPAIVLANVPDPHEFQEDPSEVSYMSGSKQSASKSRWKSQRRSGASQQPHRLSFGKKDPSSGSNKIESASKSQQKGEVSQVPRLSWGKQIQSWFKRKSETSARRT